MKKVTAFIGTQSKKATYLTVQEFERHLKKQREVEFEYVFLSDYHLEFCRSCKLCFEKGEKFCPAKDDRDLLLKKIEEADGVIFATPTYSFQVTARMKNLLDRMAYMGHRPRYFHKAFTAIVTQGLPLGSGTLKYLTFVSRIFGFNVSKGCLVTTLDPITDSQRKNLNKEAEKAAARFDKELQNPSPTPSFFELVAFRIARSGIKARDPKVLDYQYYQEKGWFDSDYYYSTSLGLVKKIVGNFSDFVGERIIKWQ